MARYQIKKGFFDAIVSLSFIFFSISTCCMDRNIPVRMNLDLQSMGRFACVCKQLQRCSFDNIYQIIPQKSACLNDLAVSYDRCTKGLRHFAEKQNIAVFTFLWNYNAQQRKEEIFRFVGHDIEDCPINVSMIIYAKEYDKIEKAKEREKHVIIKQEKKKKKEIEEIVNKRMEESIRKERQKLDILKWRLNHGSASLLKLHNKNIDISTLFPHKNDKELLKLLCKNASAEKGFVLMTNKYIVQYPAETMDYLFKLGKFWVMRYLVTNGQLDINAQSTSGKTLLHYLNYKCGCQCDLYFNGRCSDPQEILDDLLKRGADVNIVDNKGMTPLHYACKYLHVTTIKKLLAVKNIDIKKKNKKNKRPCDYVDYLWDYDDNNVKRDRKFIKLLLQSHGL